MIVLIPTPTTTTYLGASFDTSASSGNFNLHFDGAAAERQFLPVVFFTLTAPSWNQLGQPSAVCMLRREWRESSLFFLYLFLFGESDGGRTAQQKMSSAQWLIPAPPWFMAPPRLFCRSLWCHITQAAQTTAPDIAAGEQAREREEGWGIPTHLGWTQLQRKHIFIPLSFLSWHQIDWISEN